MTLPHEIADASDELVLDDEPRWFNSAVTCHQGPLEQVRGLVPDFERRAFAASGLAGWRHGVNPRLDAIVRRPFGDDRRYVPVGVVGKGYAFVPHRKVIDVAARAIEEAGIGLDDVTAELQITEHGERMVLSLVLPDEHSFDPGDGYPMALRLQCFNSVDGSTRFRALMGWFRFVCSNGLIVGVTRHDIRKRHVGEIDLDHVGATVRAGVREAVAERATLTRWRRREVAPGRVAEWADRDLREAWGFKAAARAFNIALDGWDVAIDEAYNRRLPSTIRVHPTTMVPGTPAGCRNLFDISQVLAWLARERRDVQQQLEWRERIPALLQPLAV